MKSIKAVFTFTLLLFGLIVAPGSSQAQAETIEPRTVHTLAAAPSSTVFAETSNGAYGGYNFENGSYWFRDGYAYPAEIGNNQGGWGFSENENYGSYHPNNCHGNIDPNGLCFETGDADGYRSFYQEDCPWPGHGKLCPSAGYNKTKYAIGDHYYTAWYCMSWQDCGWWWTLGGGYTQYFKNVDTWVGGSRGHVRAGGTLGSEENPDAYRVFLTSDDPSYYPSGVQHDVPLKVLYKGGWTLCWSGSYNEYNTAVSDIQNSCRGEYTMMAGSYEDPHIESPTISKPTMDASNGLVAASWTITNRDQVELSNGVGRITDLESRKQFTCEIDMAIDMSQTENTVGCSFAESMLQRYYSLTMSFEAKTFGTITGGEISGELVITDEFQVVPSKTTAKISQEAEVCAYHAAPKTLIMLKVGRQARIVRTDFNGYACAYFLMPDKASRQILKASYGRVKSIESVIYMPTYKFYYRGGKSPRLTIDVRGLPKFASVELSRVAQSSNTWSQYQFESTEAMKSIKFVSSVSVQPETYDLYVNINKVSYPSSVLDVILRSAGGGIRN